MNIAFLSLLLSVATAIYVAIFTLHCRQRMKDIAESVERCCEVVANCIGSNIVKFRRPGSPRSAVIVNNDELEQSYRCTFGKDEA